MSAAYPGGELELFAAATNWKTYFASVLSRYVRGRVLEVGAGLGANTGHLINPAVTAWTALEPDPRFADSLRDNLARVGGMAERHVVTGTIADLPNEARFDTILYIDVLEHIEDDAAEARHAARLLAPGGRLVVLSPAHGFLYSPFDAAIGHYRRYSVAGLRAVTPPPLTTELYRLLDSVGLFASLANRLALRQADPTARQIAVWDRLMVPASRVLDRLSGYRFGKSVVIVWRAAEACAAA
jgi:SAM-dependent methyltransferase